MCTYLKAVMKQYLLHVRRGGIHSCETNYKPIPID